jgi:hypothetical protein
MLVDLSPLSSSSRATNLDHAKDNVYVGDAGRMVATDRVFYGYDSVFNAVQRSSTGVILPITHLQT